MLRFDPPHSTLHPTPTEIPPLPARSPSSLFNPSSLNEGGERAKKSEILGGPTDGPEEGSSKGERRGGAQGGGGVLKKGERGGSK